MWAVWHAALFVFFLQSWLFWFLYFWFFEHEVEKYEFCPQIPSSGPFVPPFCSCLIVKFGLWGKKGCRAHSIESACRVICLAYKGWIITTNTHELYQWYTGLIVMPFGDCPNVAIFSKADSNLFIMLCWHPGNWNVERHQKWCSVWKGWVFVTVGEITIVCLSIKTLYLLNCKVCWSGVYCVMFCSVLRPEDYIDTKSPVPPDLQQPDCTKVLDLPYSIHAFQHLRVSEQMDMCCFISSSIWKRNSKVLGATVSQGWKVMQFFEGCLGLLYNHNFTVIEVLDYRRMLLSDAHLSPVSTGLVLESVLWILFSWRFISKMAVFLCVCLNVSILWIASVAN